MEITAGTALGLKLGELPEGHGVRPTSVRARRAFFDSIGTIEGKTFADLFAGSGCMGLEAASRGAATVIFAEESPDALALIRHNLGRFSMLDFVRSLPPACVITLHVRRLPDYFLVHPALWHGAAVPPSGADVTLSLTDSGLILSGRLATPEESAALAALPPKGERVAVVSATEELLGRNGMRIIVRDGDRWRLGSNPTALRWVEILRR